MNVMSKILAAAALALLPAAALAAPDSNVPQPSAPVAGAKPAAGQPAAPAGQKPATASPGQKPAAASAPGQKPATATTGQKPAAATQKPGEAGPGNGSTEPHVLGDHTPKGAPPITLSAADKATIARIQQYLNGIHTMSARFVQVADDGHVAQGAVYLSRPGKLRIQYDPPNPVLMIASGIYLSIYDPELKHTTFLPVESTPAWFLIQDAITLDGGITVTKVERAADTIRVTLHEAGHPDSGRLTLVFSDQPLQLKKWTVVDSSGKPVNVALNNAIFDGRLDPDLFKFVEPDAKPVH